MSRWRLLSVRGPSMVPTLYHGDVVLVRRSRSIVAGTVVVGRFRVMPDQLVIKRAVRPSGGGWLLFSDNPFAGGDSAAHGVADVEAEVRLRWNRTLVCPRRVAGKRPEFGADGFRSR